VSKLLARYRQFELDQEAAERVRKAVDEGEEPEPNPRAEPLDPARLRGIPAVGRLSGGSATKGTRPDHAILRLDRRRS
jgi:hypothetical protein